MRNKSFKRSTTDTQEICKKVKLQPQEQTKSQDQYELDHSFQLEGFIG